MIKLVENCESWYKLWSIRLAAIVAMIAAALVADKDFALSLINLVPDKWRPLAAVGTGIITFVLPTLTRLVSQPSLIAPKDQP